MADQDVKNEPVEEQEEVEEEEEDEGEVEDEAQRRALAAKEEARRLYLEQRLAPPPMPQPSEIIHNKMGGYEFYEKVLKKPRFVTAPMVDQSFLAFRMLTRKYNAELCYTPMLHSKTFSHDPTYRKKYFSTAPEDRPLIVQFCANEPLFLLKAARLVEDRCDAVDINLGCPQNIARKGNYGAFLMENSALVYELVNILHKYLKIPVFCKMRIFPSEEDTLKFAKMLESAGCQLLTVHGRTKEQKGHNQGLADWNVIRKIKESLSIPVIANGNIRYFSDVQESLDATKADGVMSAETILCNPALFSGKIVHPCDLSHEFMDLCEQKYPTQFKYIRTHLLQILKEKLDLNADLRIALMKTRNITQTRKVIEDIRSRDSNGNVVLKDIELREKRAQIKAEKVAELQPGGEKEFIESHSLFVEDSLT